MNANEVRDAIIHWAQFKPADYEVAQSRRGAMIGMINSAVRLGASANETSQRRKEVLAWIFRDYLGRPGASQISSKELPDECWFALDMYAETSLDAETGRWIPRPGFDQEMVLCWVALAKWHEDMRVLCGEAEDER